MSIIAAPELAEQHAVGATLAHQAYGSVAPILCIQYDAGETIAVQLHGEEAMTVGKVTVSLLPVLPRPTHVVLVTAVEEDPDDDVVALILVVDLTLPGRGAFRLVHHIGGGLYGVDGEDNDPGEGYIVDIIDHARKVYRDDDHTPPPGTTVLDILTALSEMELIAGAMSSDPRIES